MKNLFKQQNKQTIRTAIAAFLSLAFCISMLALPSFAYDAEGKFECVKDITQKPMAELEGSIYADEVHKAGNLDDMSLMQTFNSEIDSIQALRNGKVDSVLNSDIGSSEYVRTYDDIMIFPEPGATIDYAFGFPKGSPLRDEFNAAMEQLNAEGMTEMLYNKWMDGHHVDAEPIRQDWVGEKGTVQYWINVGPPPMAYVSGDGEIIGYTIDLVYLVYKKMGYNVEVTECNFSGLIPALKAGNADMAGRTMVVTEERKESIDFSDPFYYANLVFTVRKSDVSQSILEQYGISEATKKNVFESLKDSFIKTFFTEDRWELFAQGIRTTLLITVLSAIFGTVLGMLFYLLFRLENKWVNRILLKLNKWISGIPVVVFLMVMFYIIFKKSFLGGTAISVVTFTIIFGIAVFGLISNGVDSVGKGQTEAGLALGFTPTQTLFMIVLPQAITQVMPLYRTKLVEHLKNTSIVGYIAVQDLTKMSDLVRSRTFEAFFPLIVTAIIYYLLGSLLDMVLVYIDKRRKPELSKSRLLKGVNLK